MCEIAILRPSEYSVAALKEAALTLYRSMPHSLGLVSIRDPEDTDTFRYDVFKTIRNEPEGLEDFLSSAKEKGAIRLVIHGRLATEGAVTVEHAHPLEIDCEECDVDYVLHNGMLSQYVWDKQDHEQEGHTYSTEVDSEVIAHSFGDVPDNFDFESEYNYQPAYILMNEDRVYIHGRRYHLAKDGRMAHLHRDFGPDRREKSHRAVILTPEE